MMTPSHHDHPEQEQLQMQQQQPPNHCKSNRNHRKSDNTKAKEKCVRFNRIVKTKDRMLTMEKLTILKSDKVPHIH